MIKIVFFATPDIAVPSLEFLASQEDIECAAIITKIDKPKGRGQKIEPSPVKVCAVKNNIQVIQPKLIRTDFDAIEKLKRIQPDFFITFAYGQILSQEILDIPKYGCINIHASLLPVLRGAAPIQRSIIEGHEKTGVTIMQMEAGLDTGDMLSKAEI